MKKTSIYLFPLLIYLLFHRVLAQIQLAWWGQKNFDNTFYLLINIVLLLNSLIICLWQANILHFKPFHPSRIKWKHVPTILCLVGAIFYFNLNSSRWFSIPLTENTGSLSTILSYSNGSFYLQGFIIWNVILGPIREELFYRMLLMETYFKSSSYYLDVLLSAFAFAASHIIAAGDFQAFWIYAIPGALYALIYRFSKNIYFSTLAHILWNGFVYFDLINIAVKSI